MSTHLDSHHATTYSLCMEVQMVGTHQKRSIWINCFLTLKVFTKNLILAAESFV